MKNFHPKIPNKTFEKDNLEEYRDYLEKVNFTKYFYKIALFYKADKILYEIVTKNEYLEDYYQLYDKLGSNVFKTFYDYYKDRETDEEDYYFFKNYSSQAVTNFSYPI